MFWFCSCFWFWWSWNAYSVRLWISYHATFSCQIQIHNPQWYNSIVRQIDNYWCIHQGLPLAQHKPKTPASTTVNTWLLNFISLWIYYSWIHVFWPGLSRFLTYAAHAALSVWFAHSMLLLTATLSYNQLYVNPTHDHKLQQQEHQRLTIRYCSHCSI